MAAPRVISIGSVNLDVQVRADGWPGQGRSGIARDCLLASGGKAANVALLARRLGAAAQLIARVGDDPTTGMALESLRTAGVDLSQVRETAGRLSGVSMILVPPDGKKSILLAPNANRTWEPADEDRVEEVVRTAPAGSVVVADFEISVPVAVRAVEAAVSAGLTTVVDPAPPKDAPEGVFAMVGFATPDADEARDLTGVEVRDAESGFVAAEALRRSGVRNALVKLGGGGCVLLGEGIRTTVEADPVVPTDTTGAGDAFAGALTVALLEGRPPVEAARWAVAASTIAVTRYGSQAAYPDRKELEEQAAKVRTRNSFA